MDEDLDRLAFRFFKLFAQYESALKEHGFVRAGKQKEAFADWDRFASKVVTNKFKTQLENLVSAADYILQQPPKKQIVNEEKKIAWRDVSSDDQTAQALFRHIRRVRNNLFHGSKFNSDWHDPVRSQGLIEKSLAILEHYRVKAGVCDCASVDESRGVT